ncbi:MAG: GyrI-like domain-containing protein [Geodermatophilaceae bacterium]
MTLHDASSAPATPTEPAEISTAVTEIPAQPPGVDLPTTTPRLVDVPARQVLMLDGSGSPESADFGTAVRRLYAAAGSSDAPLEGLWTQDGRAGFELSNDKDTWQWTLLLPAGEDPDPSRLPDRVRVETFTEGRAAEVLHIGPYDDEEPTIAALLGFITQDCGLALRGRHHEIYLDDPRTCPPAELRTIIRQPVQ